MGRRVLGAVEGVIGHALSLGSVPRVRAVRGPELGGLLKSTNIQLGQEVPNGGKGGVAGGVAESACSNGGVFRSRAVSGAEIYHFKKCKHRRDRSCDLSVSCPGIQSPCRLCPGVL